MLYICDSDDRDFRNTEANRNELKLNSCFAKEQPLYLEIGCGKGRFAIEYAKQHPEINVLAVEKTANVLVTACEAAMTERLTNLYFIKCGAEYLERYLNPGTVSRIFLNFSCPYPKKSYANHRLTHKGFLEIYKRLMAPEAEIFQKTDNMQLFEFSVEQLSQSGFALKNISLDLHSSNSDAAKENIMTEYEQRFVGLGQPIYRLEAYLPDSTSRH